MRSIFSKGWFRGISFLIVFFLVTCHFADRTTHPKGIDKFYLNRGDWDDFEIPLIKPYKAIQLNGFKNWSMNLEVDGVGSVDSIKQVNVVNNAIILRSIKTYYQHREPDREVWTVVIPSKKIEEEFLTHREYVAYLKKNGFTNEPRLLDIERVADYAADYDIIDWKKIK
ncbi:hypothetical protein [Mucilaginibacter pedocola]|uniref:Uncharacterized protein n=1 Tax=Mucilaginibacter pedocola TaxID=1792845 RepID=A0A1S9P760_9SPHI|nr:hypothetical protein [Mucilaginibacter pedocola]OOQ56488.1 hypothetical protein BC343_18765 [Mucilaginibacter pedocola]